MHTFQTTLGADMVLLHLICFCFSVSPHLGEMERNGFEVVRKGKLASLGRFPCPRQELCLQAELCPF